jgi:carotenoid cleavage dioxygenase-like enzyme
MATALLNFANSVIDYTLPEEEVAKAASVVAGPFKPVEGNARCVNLPVTQGNLRGFPTGMYFRNGPNPLIAPKAQHHWFDGDGKLQAIKV